MDSSPPSPPSIRILAFGDSLTYGYYKQGRSCHPYSQRLGELLPQEASIDVEGEPGERLRDMVPRLHQLLNRHTGEEVVPAKEDERPYTHVIVLGGTNDVGTGGMSQDIHRQVLTLHRICHSHNCKTMMITIPDTATIPGAQAFVDIREEANRLIRESAEGESNPNLAFLDLNAQLPYEKEFFDDAIHFSPAGYDRLGELIFAAASKEPGFLGEPYDESHPYAPDESYSPDRQICALMDPPSFAKLNKAREEQEGGPPE